MGSEMCIRDRLLDAGADPNQKGDEITALKGTVSRISFENYNEKMDMLNRLLESGAKPDSDIVSFLLNDDNSNWGMQYYFTPQILKKLEKYDGKQNISQGLRAAMNGDDHKLQKLVISDKINKKDNKVLVEGVNMLTKHTKPSAANQNGGIIHQEGPIDASNVMYLHKGKATRVGFKMDGDKKVRVAKSTGEVID